MKKVIFSLVVLTIAISIFAQAPQAFKYQAVARDNAGNVLANQNISFRIEIIQESPDGIEIYGETHELITNEYGLVNMEIGNGNVIFGVFEEIEWGYALHFMKILMDENGGINYQDMGTSQLLSVPYAIHSGTTSDTSTWKKEADNIYYKKGNVGIGTDLPAQLLSANGIIESMADGFMFPDGSVQSTAASSSASGTSDTITFGGPATAADERGFIGMYMADIPGSWEWGLDCEDCSVVFDLKWSIYQPYDANTGGYAGNRLHNVLTVYKNIDKASVVLLQRLVNSNVISEVILKFYRYNDIVSNFEVYYAITLENARVVYFNHDVYHTGNKTLAHMDQVSFIYQTISWEWMDGGIMYQDDWGAWPPGKK